MIYFVNILIFTMFACQSRWQTWVTLSFLIKLTTEVASFPSKTVRKNKALLIQSQKIKKIINYKTFPKIGISKCRNRYLAWTGDLYRRLGKSVSQIIQESWHFGIVSEYHQSKSSTICWHNFSSKDNIDNSTVCICGFLLCVLVTDKNFT